MRISFYNASLAMALAAGLCSNQVEAIRVERPIEYSQVLTEDIIDEAAMAQTDWVSDEPMGLAQTGAEAMYFKKIINFAKDAIRTIAPALSSQNKFNASTAGVIDQQPWVKHFTPVRHYHPPVKHFDSNHGLAGQHTAIGKVINAANTTLEKKPEGDKAVVAPNMGGVGSALGKIASMILNFKNAQPACNPRIGCGSVAKNEFGPPQGTPTAGPQPLGGKQINGPPAGFTGGPGPQPMGGTVVSGPPQTQTGGGLASLLGAGHHQAPAMATVVNQAVAANKAATPATQAQKLSSPEAMTEVGSESRAEEPNKNWGSSVLSYKGA